MPNSKDNSRLKLDKKTIESVREGSPLAWAMEQLKHHLETSMDIKSIIESLRIDINEYGNIEMIIEMSPEIAVIVGESIMSAGKRPNFLEDEDDPK
ncbi:MAG: hypothetical protein ACYSOO_06460 [Planctomycetota bacterium]|jgi:hypothetical protein